jgi:hypothetical protein
MNNINDLNQPKTPNTNKTDSSLGDKIGDAVEGIGHKISDLGMPSVGQKIHDLGDKFEKKHDDPNHPHDV